MIRPAHELDEVPMDGWRWLDVYVLDEKGDAVERRALYVRVQGVLRCNGREVSRRDHQVVAGADPSNGRNV
jgi:hypothetical protein